MWVLVSAVRDTKLIGRLANDPEGKIPLRPDEAIEVEIDQIEDWMIGRGGKKYIGGFSVPVLDEIERERRRGHRSG